ncbi:MAG: LysE family transporter [Candidatus Omnitrophica bacterium]|nr:LysE family transporter [Candidatus Omnitrophota bacterium]
MNLFTVFFISFTVALSGSLAPGPLLATVIYESSRHGFKSGPLIILGHAIAEIAMVALIALGLSKIINNPLVLKFIFFSGAAILIFFGINMLSSLPRVNLDLKTTRKKSSGLVMTGFTMSISNPYWSIWWLTFGMGMVLGAQKAGFSALAVFFIGHILADLSWYSMISFALSKGKKLISLKIYKGIILLCAIALLLFGVYFGISSFK